MAEQPPSQQPPHTAAKQPQPPPPTTTTTTPHNLDSLIEDYYTNGNNLILQIPPETLLTQLLSTTNKKDSTFSLLSFLEDTCHLLITAGPQIERLLTTLRTVIQSPVEVYSYTLKEQFLISTTSVFISVDAVRIDRKCLEGLVELLLTVVSRFNHGPDRHARGVACECLRELERFYPCLLANVGGHLWNLCQNERSHVLQYYLLLFCNVVYNVVDRKLAISIFNSSLPLVPFNVPSWVLGLDGLGYLGGSGFGGGGREGLNYKELRRAMAFLLESSSLQVLTPSAMMEFMEMVVPVAVALELQPSMLKVQFFGMVYSFNPVLCHSVLRMFVQFGDAFDGQEVEVVKRLMSISRETQHVLVFRLLAVKWLLGFLNSLVLTRGVEKYKAVLDLGLRFYLSVFDPLSLKALKLDLIAFCSICVGSLNRESSLDVDGDSGKLVVKLFKDGLVSVSAFKWLPPWSTETSVAFRALYKFLIGASSHSDADPSTTRILLDSVIFQALQGMLVDMAFQFQRLVPIVVSFICRLLSCQKHLWLAEHLLQALDEHMLPKVKVDYKLVAYFPLFDRIAENHTIPPCRLLDLLLKFMAYLAEQHGPDMGLQTWSYGSKVLSICRTMIMHHQSSRLFLSLSHLLAFTCLYFPDLEVRDNARIYLRMLICVPGLKLRALLTLGEQLIGITPSPHSSSFYNIQSPRHFRNVNKYRSVSSYIHLDRVVPLLVKQSWSLSLSPLGTGSSKPKIIDSTEDNALQIKRSKADDRANFQTEQVNLSKEPLCVMDAKISEILTTLRRHFSCIPDLRHMPGLKIRILCNLRFESEPFNRVWGVDSPISQFDVDALAALYATVLKFSSSAFYGSIPSYHIPFLLGEPPKTNYDGSGLTVSLDIVPVDVFEEEDDETFRAPVTIELEPREPTPGLVDVFIEANTENGHIVHGQLESVTVGIEDMFLKAIIPPDLAEDTLPSYCAELFDALWEACGSSSNIGRETFLLKGGKGVAAISGTRSVKLLEAPAEYVIEATERYLAPFVVGVVGELLVNTVRDRGNVKNVVWKDDETDSLLDDDSTTPSVTDISDKSQLHLLTYFSNEEGETTKETSISRRKMGCFQILIFLPPRFHLLFEMEVCEHSTLVRIRTDHWPCLAYVDDYLEALFLV